MKNKYNKKNIRKLKIISLSLGVVSLASVVAIVAPLVIQKNSLSVVNSISSNTINNSSFVQKPSNLLGNFATVNSLDNYSFPLLNADNESNITSGGNIQNLYNINGSSIMYAASKSTNNSNNNIDSIVSINQGNNNVNWAIDSTSIISAVNEFTTANSGQSINTIFDFNKMVYSPASASVFLDLYVGTTNDLSTGYTVIVQISNMNSATPTISNYFNASTTNGRSNNSVVLSSFENSNFSQFVIQADGQSPTLHLMKSKYTEADSTNSSSQYNLISFTVLNNNIQGGSSNTGVIIRTPLTISSSDISFLQSNSTNALYITNSFWSSGGTNGGLVIILSRNSISNLNDYATMYSFAASTSTFLNNPSSQILSLSLPQFNSTQPIMLNLETIGSNLFLIGSQNNGNATSGAFNSNGSIVALQINININGNNASISLTTYSNNNLLYGNGQQILGIVNVLNTNNLPSASQYVALTSGGALVILNSSFTYLNELATIPNSFFPAGVSVLKLITNGLNYLVYLSNGSIIVFNNTGYLGYLSNISSDSNNTIQSISPISFIQQQNVTSGVAIFTQPLNNFTSNVTSLGNQLIFSLINTNNRSINYLVKSETVTNDNASIPYSAQVTLTIYQQLTMVNSQGTSISSNIISTVFLGSHTYNIYNKAGTVINNLITSLPSSLQNILASSITAEQVMQYLLVITNIDTTDLYTNGNNNISVTLSPNDSEGTLVVNVRIGSYWVNVSGPQQSGTLNFTISGFAVGPSANQLSYTLNPNPISGLEQKYNTVSPDTLTNADVLLDFIKLSPYLEGLQGTTIAIVPNVITGTATITITFNFSNPFFVLPGNSSASLVTRNSITWNTPAVFLTNPTVNSSILFSFNSSQFIAANFPQTINNLPTTIGSILSAMQSLPAKIEWLIDKGFINASSFVQNDITNATVVTGASSDYTGSFSLLIELNNPLPNSLQKTYLYNYTGFSQNAGQVNATYIVTNLTKGAYEAQFSKSKPFNSIFNVEPSLITKNNIINAFYKPSTNINQLTGYLVELNDLAASSQYTVNLTPDDSNGSLLITIVFSDYIGLSSDNLVTNIKNKTFVFTYTGFKTSSSIQQFSLNWKSPSQLDTQLLVLSPTDAVKSISTGTSAITQLEMFADLSQTAINLYQNAQLINIQYIPNDLNGSILINTTLSNWNGDLAPQIFSQDFTGFLIPQSAVVNSIETFNPFVNNSEQMLTQFKTLVPSTITASQWLSLFNFSTTILNPLEKRIYILFNDQTGYVSFVLFAKPATINSTPSTTSTTSAIQSDTSSQFIFLQEIPSGTTTTPTSGTANGGTDTTPSNSTSGIDFSNVPMSQLTSEGFVEMKNNSQKLFSGFKQQDIIYTPPNNTLSIILASVIPSVLFIPIILYLAISKNKKAIKNVRAKIAKRLEEEYIREKELDEDDK